MLDCINTQIQTAHSTVSYELYNFPKYTESEEVGLNASNWIHRLEITNYSFYKSAQNWFSKWKFTSKMRCWLSKKINLWFVGQSTLGVIRRRNYVWTGFANGGFSVISTVYWIYLCIWSSMLSFAPKCEKLCSDSYARCVWIIP